jgi:hypothetical protein
VGADRPDESDVPPDGPADDRDDEGGGGGGDGRPAQASGAQPETRHRQEYYAELRVAVSAAESVTAKQAAAT